MVSNMIKVSSYESYVYIIKVSNGSYSYRLMIWLILVNNGCTIKVNNMVNNG